MFGIQSAIQEALAINIQKSKESDKKKGVENDDNEDRVDQMFKKADTHNYQDE